MNKRIKRTNKRLRAWIESSLFDSKIALGTLLVLVLLLLPVVAATSVTSGIVGLLIAIIIAIIVFQGTLAEIIYKVTPEEYHILKKIYPFIEKNSLYLEDKGKITFPVYVELEVTDERVYITFIGEGSKLTDRIQKLDAEIQNAFPEYLLCDKQIKRGETIYVFRKTPEARLEFGDGNVLDDNLEINITQDFKWNFTKIPHGLITGTTGGGKTFFLFYLLYAFTKMKSDIYIIDPKRSDLYSLRYTDVPYKDRTYCTPEEISEVLEDICKLMNDRYEEIGKSGRFGITYKDLGFKPIVVVADELSALMAEADLKQRKEITAKLRQIINKGRQAGVIAILSMQKPSADILDTGIRDQLGLRVILGNLSDEGYRMVFGTQDMTYLRNEQGEGYLFYQDQSFAIPQQFKSPFIRNLEELIEDMEISENTQKILFDSTGQGSFRL